MTYDRNPNRGQNRKPGKAAPAQKMVMSDDNRAIFNNVNAKAKQEGKIATPGYIRLEKLLTAGKNRYQFTFLRDSNSDTVTERKLDRNDKFTITELGIFLMKRASGTAGIEVLQTYPNASAFPVSSGVLNPAHLEFLYNGSMSLSVGQTKFIEALDLNRFRKVPQMIQTSSVVNSQREEKDGFIKMTPQITIDGDAKTTLEIEVPAIASLELGTDVFVVIVARGFQVTAK